MCYILMFTLQKCIIVLQYLLAPFRYLLLPPDRDIYPPSLPPYLVEVEFTETAITVMESSGNAIACLSAMSVNPIEVTVMVVTTTTGTATGMV